MSSYSNIFKGIEYILKLNADGISHDSKLGKQSLSWSGKTDVEIWNIWLFIATPNMSFVIPIEAINMPADNVLEAIKTWSKAKSAAPLF